MVKKEICKAIKSWLNENKWKYDIAPNSSIIYLGVALKSQINRLRVIIDVRDDFFLVYAIPGIGGSENIPELMKFFTMANYGLINGNFEMDIADGEIRYKTYVNCTGLKALPSELIEDSILCACHTVRRYSSGIAKLCLLPGQSKADEEIAKCEEWQNRKTTIQR